MASFNKLYKETPTITAIAVVTQDFVLFDEEFNTNKKIQKNIDKQSFWIDIAQIIYDKLSQSLVSTMDEEGFDEQESTVSDVVIYNYVLDHKNRLALNDTICDAVESWIAFH